MSLPPFGGEIPPRPVTVCGAKRRTCECGHHLNEHRATKRDQPTACREEDCSCAEYVAARCQLAPLRGATRCKKHGGKAQIVAAQRRGPANPAFRHGRYSKYMPKRLRSRTEQMLKDADVLSLVDNIAAIDARIAEVYEEIAAGQAGNTLEVLRKLRIAYLTARRNADNEAMIAALNQILNTIAQSPDLTAEYGELSRLHDQRRRMVDSEVRRQTADHQSITIDRAYGLMMFLVDVVARHIKDPAIVHAIMEDVQRYTEGPEQQHTVQAEIIE